MKQKCYHY